MHRTINIDMVTSIEYCELLTEADMNLYELFYILKLRPPLNVDDKARDDLTVSLPELTWREFHTDLWEKWKIEIHSKNSEHERKSQRYRVIPEELRILRSAYNAGEMAEEEWSERSDALKREQDQLRKELFSVRDNSDW